MQYVIDREDTKKCYEFAKKAYKSTFNYSADPVKNTPENRILNIYVGKLGEMGLLYFLKECGIDYYDDGMFEVYGNESVGDKGDIIMPNKKIIDVKTTRYSSIGVNSRDLHKYDYFVGTSLKMNDHNPTIDPIIEIRGYTTKRAAWKRKTSYGVSYLSIGLIYLHDINDIVNEWGAI